MHTYTYMYTRALTLISFRKDYKRKKAHEHARELLRPNASDVRNLRIAACSQVRPGRNCDQ